MTRSRTWLSSLERLEARYGSGPRAVMQRAAVGFDDGSRDGKPEPRSAPTPRGRAAGEALEEPGEEPRRKAGPVVDDVDGRSRSRVRELHDHGARAVLLGIPEQVV